MNKKLLSVLSSTALLLPLLASAQQITIVGIVASITDQVWAVGTWIVIIAWVITGVLFLIAQGDPGKLKTARTALFTSIAGTIVIILAPMARQLIENSL